MTAALGSKPSSWALEALTAGEALRVADHAVGHARARRGDGRRAAVRVGGHHLDAQPAAAVAALGHVRLARGAGDVRPPLALQALPAVAEGERAVTPGAGERADRGAA